MKEKVLVYGIEKDFYNSFTSPPIENHKLKIKKCIGAGRLKYFPYLSTINLYTITK